MFDDDIIKKVTEPIEISTRDNSDNAKRREMKFQRQAEVDGQNF